MGHGQKSIQTQNENGNSAMGLSKASNYITFGGSVGFDAKIMSTRLPIGIFAEFGITTLFDLGPSGISINGTIAVESQTLTITIPGTSTGAGTPTNVTIPARNIEYKTTISGIPRHITIAIIPKFTIGAEFGF